MTGEDLSETVFRESFCKTCQAEFSCKDALLVHQKKYHHSNSDFFCDSCQSHFNRRKGYIKHMSEIHHEKSYDTKKDGNSSSGETDPEDSEPDQISDRKFYCEPCDYSYASESIFKCHEKRVHSNGKFSCSECKVLFTKEITLEMHLQKKHNIFKNSPRSTQSCDYCQKIFHSKERLSNHMSKVHGSYQRHARNEVIFCTMCDGSFVAKSTLIYHIEKVHGKKFDENMLSLQKVNFEKPPNTCDPTDYLRVLRDYRKDSPTKALPTAPSVTEKAQTIPAELQENQRKIDVDFNNLRCTDCKKEFATRGSTQIHYRKIHGVSIDKIQDLDQANLTCSDCDARFVREFSFWLKNFMHITESYGT